MKNEKDNVKTTARRKRHKKYKRLVEYLPSLPSKPVRQPKSPPGQLLLFPLEAAKAREPYC